MPCRGSGNPRDALYKPARAAGSWMRSLHESLRRRQPAQWRREPQLTETPTRSMAPRKQLTETPIRSMPSRKQLTEMFSR